MFLSNTPRRPAQILERKGYVASAISTRSVAGLSFTAYEITQELRQSHPDIEIVHDDIRADVYEIAPAYGYDTGVMTDFGSYTATLYSPRHLPQAQGVTVLPDDDGDTDTTPLQPDNSGPTAQGTQKLLMPGIPEL